MSQNSPATTTLNESFAYYEGALGGLPSLLVGKLIMTPGYLAFRIHEVHKRGLLEQASLKPTGNIISMPFDKIVSATIEWESRAKTSRPNWKDHGDFARKASGERKLNAKPTFLESSERFAKLVITVETEHGVQLAFFETEAPQVWVHNIGAKLKRHVF